LKRPLAMRQLLTVRNNIHLTGSGDKVIFFVHGFGCNQLMWRFITPAFEKDYTIVLIDLVGCGKSDETAYNYTKYNTLVGYADDIIEICENYSLKEVILVGHSVSAMIATLAVNKQPNLFKKLIMLCPSPRYINDENYIGGFTQPDIDEMIKLLNHNYIGWAKNFVPLIVKDISNPSITRELSESFCNNNSEIASHFAKVTFLGDNRNDIKKIQTETLIIQSSNDNIAPLEVGHYLHQNIALSKLTIIDTIGHTPHLYNPELVIEAIKKFI
jgi:sigma-B regulation protein RsbQ